MTEDRYLGTPRAGTHFPPAPARSGRESNSNPQVVKEFFLQTLELADDVAAAVPERDRTQAVAADAEPIQKGADTGPQRPARPVAQL